MSEPVVGAIVEIPAGRGVIRFVGSTSFQAGKWVGIELYEPKGKNDGSVQGVQYFTCKMLHGMFVRPSQVKAILGMEKPAASMSRSTLGHQRSNSLRSSTSPRAGSPQKAAATSSAGLKAPASPTKLSPKPSPSPSRSSTSLASRRTSVLRQSSSSSVPDASSAPDTSYFARSRSDSTAPTPATPRTRTNSTYGATRVRTDSSAAAAARNVRAASPAKRTSSPLATQPPSSAQSVSLARRGSSLAASPPQRLAPTPELVVSPTSFPSAESPAELDDSSPNHSPVLSEPLQSFGTAASAAGLSSAHPHPDPQRAERPAASDATSISPSTSTGSTLSVATLQSKIRVFESKAVADAHQITSLNSQLSQLLAKYNTELEFTKKVKTTLQPRLQQLQAENNSLRAETAQLQNELVEARESGSGGKKAGLDPEERENLENQIAEASEQAELAMLDREMAEERAETKEEECRELRERVAQLEVEIGVLKKGGSNQSSAGEGDEEEGDQDDSVKSSVAYAQLERQNERLKEALIRLRDLSQEAEREHRRRIAELEKDADGVDDIQAQYATTLDQLTSAELLIDDLKAQLDAAEGADDLLVQLTDRNDLLNDKIQEMQITIEDLEALKDLNDELEENHVETERIMQEEIDAKDAQVREHINKIALLEEACQDLEGTISQFRDLVMQLQSELDALRTQTQTAQSESDRAVNQTAAMMSLNLKLQSTAAKNQARNIELELLRIEAREAKELLGIVQPYLPQMYLEADNDAANCYLFFQRLAFKADLISSTVAQAHGLPESMMNGPVHEVLLGVCEMRGHIASLSSLCRRLAGSLRRCEVDAFLAIGRLFPEVAPMEKRLDMHISLLRKDSFREMECASDVLNMHRQLEHLSEAYFTPGIPGYGAGIDIGERAIGCVLAVECDLDIFVAAVGLSRTMVMEVLKDDDTTTDLGGMDVEAEFLGPIQKLLDKCKSVRNTSKKLTKRVEDLFNDSEAPKTAVISALKALNNVPQDLVNFGINLAQEVVPHVNDARGAKAPFRLASVVSFVRQTALSTVAKDASGNAVLDSSAWDAVSASLERLGQEASQTLQSLMEPENIGKVSGVAPWALRVEEIKAALAVNVEAERKMAQLNDEMQGLARNLRTKEQDIQEKVVKIELMERRMEAVKKQADVITDLEGQLVKAKKQERAYEEAMEQLQADLDALEQDNAKLKAMPAGQERTGPLPTIVETETIPIEGSLETSYLLEQVDALRGTVRYLRTENSYLKSHDLLKEIQALPPIPEPLAPTREPTPELVPASGLSSDSEESDDDSIPTHRARSLRGLSTETKVLYRDVMRFSSSPRVVDLSVLNANRAAEEKGEDSTTKGARKVWMPKKKTPAYQVMERKMEAERLSRRVRGLLNRASHLST
ncbi:hypothetical protein HGRIS_008587 [Hohenbuehelia grisea]|uniref:CAP-Gly domain-containing protein n=1 Tax=Hohenbuehelia grisea TaxID=104357 RepID=A0ABR3J8H8_9AGAR